MHAPFLDIKQEPAFDAPAFKSDLDVRLCFANLRTIVSSPRLPLAYLLSCGVDAA